MRLKRLDNNCKGGGAITTVAPGTPAIEESVPLGDFATLTHPMISALKSRFSERNKMLLEGKDVICLLSWRFPGI